MAEVNRINTAFRRLFHAMDGAVTADEARQAFQQEADALRQELGIPAPEPKTPRPNRAAANSKSNTQGKGERVSEVFHTIPRARLSTRNHSFQVTTAPAFSFRETPCLRNILTRGAC